ncbi:MAG: fumarylacetoacetate hydrolase family protein, partial [Halocynthiibacter sp.]
CANGVTVARGLLCGAQAGLIHGAEVVVCDQKDPDCSGVLSLIRNGNMAQWQDQMATGPRLALSDVRLRAPMPALRRDLICVGKNYHDHAAEFFGSGFDATANEAVPQAPIFFTKSMTSVIGPGDKIDASLDPTASVDYEGELGVVIGKTARRVKKSEAFDYVFGYVIVNDVTSRKLQKKHNQWTIGKGLDTFCPMGPWIATPDELGDIDELTLETWVNGQSRQRAQIKDMVFDIATLIETITQTGTLLAGDILATGTPAGVGIGFDPPKYLRPGDSVAVSITGLGKLENTVI